MTRKLVALDRLVVGVVGLALIALGLLALDWRGRYVFDSYVTTQRTTPAQDVLESGWWPWAFAAAGLVLGLLGLWWLAAHLRRVGPSTLRVSTSDETGRVEVDLRSVAAAAAAHLGTIAPVANPRGTVKTYGAVTVVELRGQVDASADVAALVDGATLSSAHIASAFADDQVECRVILDAPRRTRTTRGSNRVRVH